MLAQPTNDRFDPPSSTVQVGTIEGGIALNIVPKTCTFQWQVRGLPEPDPDFAPKRLKAHAEEMLLPRMRRVAPAASIETLHRSEERRVGKECRARWGRSHNEGEAADSE